MSESVAVVIPTHNRSDLLRVTLKNVLCQEGVDLQIAVVDDGSTDDTPEILASFRSDSRFVLHRLDPAGGACKARNLGVSLTDAPYVCYLDSDDLLHPEKLARQVGVLKRNADIDLAVCQMAHFEVDPNEATLLWNTFAGAEPRLRFLGHDPVWGMHAPLWRRAALDRIGGLDETLPMAQDFEFHLRALLMGCRAHLSPELLTYCRRHAGPTIGSAKNIKRIETLLNVFDSVAEHATEEPERSILLGDYLWLANYSSIRKEGGAMLRAMKRAQQIQGATTWQFTTFSALSHLALKTRRHRFYAMARDLAGRMGVDLGSREDWFLRHTIADEPGIEVFPMPGSCWQV
jgi:glycosyltransferase involved in cell wall biosynthesis